ncbi:MAG: NUDIX domain-containing protein [Lachnospiraceae bacterium]|nr:NUDIX domain-containing protein [Lachnospiraceae bacterium]
MELWDIYDVDRKLTGKTMVRGETFDDEAYHLVVHVCVFNSDGKMLIQQRQPFKHGWSGMWDVTCGGSAVKGESSRDAAHRELLEEVGIDIDFSSDRPHLTVNFEHGFDDIYLVEKDIDERTLELQYEEVNAVKWASCEEILSMIDSGEFIPYYKSLIQLMFDKRKHPNGCIREKDDGDNR